MMPTAHAIPYFARKYETSCSTCHNNFPELNDFGIVFKKNGWKFPKDEETYVKQPPVLLGAPAQKQVFPKVIYPGELPATIPVSFRYSGFLTYNSKQPLDQGFLPRTDLFTPNTFTILLEPAHSAIASRSGSMMIFPSAAQDPDGGLGDGYLRVNDLGRYIGLPKQALNLRVGQFELDLPFTQARTINPTDYDVYDQTAVAGSLGTTNNPFDAWSAAARF